MGFVSSAASTSGGLEVGYSMCAWTGWMDADWIEDMGRTGCILLWLGFSKMSINRMCE